MTHDSVESYECAVWNHACSMELCLRFRNQMLVVDMFHSNWCSRHGPIECSLLGKCRLTSSLVVSWHMCANVRVVPNIVCQSKSCAVGTKNFRFGG